MTKYSLICIVLSLLSTCLLYSADLEYQSPGGIIEEIFNRPYNPGVSLYQKLGLKIYKERSLYIPLDFLAEPIVRYAGIQVYEKSRSSVRSSFYTEYKWGELYSDSLNTLPLPKNSVFGSDIPSFDGQKTVFMEYSKDKISLWMIHLDSLKAGKTDSALEKLLDGGINQVFDESVQWMPDNRHLLVRLIPQDLKKPEQLSLIPKGPIILETSGKESQNRTYPNLLKNQYDEDMFEYYGSVQLALFDTQTKTLKQILNPMMLSYTDPSPDGKYLLCKEIMKPFSRKVSYYSFPSQWIVIDLLNMKKIVLSQSPATDDLRAGWVMKGNRAFWWNAHKDNTLFRLTTLDDGNPDNEKGFRDEVSELSYPFNAKVKSIYKSRQRISNVNFINDNILYVREYDWKKKRSKAFLSNLKTYKQYTIYDKLNEEKYDLPGNIAYKSLSDGRIRPYISENSLFFIGDGLTQNSRKPFIDQLNLSTFTKKRLIELDEQDYVSIAYLMDENPNEFLLYRENPQTPLNLYVYNLKTKTEKAITNFDDNIPELTRLQKRVIKYTRPDNVQLSGILYLPADYDSTKALPLIMSAYPQEFSDPETASQTSHTDKRYNRPWSSSPLYFCLNGFAVLQDASFPIVGDPQTVNDTWMEQAVSNAKAAIDYLAKEGIVDSNKVIIQGHSYGAFMVVNLMAHSNLFAGGIAKNGAYNRTLTPFGFQKERRNLWEAKDVYLKLSPFLYANKIQKPLLLIHSMEDTNPGTFPIQSQRLYEALEGNGKICRYVQLPLEDHSYSAKETHLHLLWEYQEFFKNVLK